MKRLFLTQHAQDAVDERKIDLEWIESTYRHPDWTVPDPRRRGVERRFRAIPENEAVSCASPAMKRPPKSVY
jgi:hypothetical protein